MKKTAAKMALATVVIITFRLFLWPMVSEPTLDWIGAKIRGRMFPF